MKLYDIILIAISLAMDASAVTISNCTAYKRTLTKKRKWFLQGRIQVAQYVITRNANVVRTSPELVFINQVKDCVEFKQDWKDQAKQPSLFD